MHVIFLDDSHRRNGYLGHGGFCIKDSDIGQLNTEIAKLKDDFHIPQDVELKWSPEPEHYLNTKFEGSRRQLYRKAISILHKCNTTAVCAVHDTKNCYGFTHNNWEPERLRLWATKQQIKYIAERFERPYLHTCDDNGLMVIDQYGGQEGQKSITEQASQDIYLGTKYRQFEKLCILPLTTRALYCPPLQLADIVVGIIVASLDGSNYALEHFEETAKLFLKNPHEKAISFASSFSAAVLGYGLTLFPQTFRTRGLELFVQLDSKYIHTSEGLEEKVC